MQAISIGLSSLTANQQALDIIGQNIANANTPGYSRQIPVFTATSTNNITGLGVNLSTVRRQRDNLIESAFTNNQTAQATVGTQGPILTQLQTFLGSGTGSIDGGLNSFFNNVEQLTANPSDQSQQRVVLSSLSSLATQFNQTASNLDTLRDSTRGQISNVIGQINSLTPKIADLNNRIQATEASGTPANDLRDQRDQLINNLAQLVDIRRVDLAGGGTTIIAGNVPVVVGSLSDTLKFSTDPAGNAIVTAGASAVSPNISGGQLAGLLQAVNTTIPGYSARLDTLAQGFAQAVNTIQATGLSINGPSTILSGNRGVSSATIPLSTANPQFPVQAGTLSVSVTDQSTGARTLTQVAIDPTTQSLTQIAANITAATGGQVQATVNAANNSLQFQAQAGFAFDFAGQPPTTPIETGFAGTTVPTVGGLFTGANNDNYKFTLVGSGTVGTTPGLALQVTDQNNAPVATLNIGAGYNPGTPIPVANGVTVQLSAGTFTAGTFSSPVVSNPDTSGVLSALGVNDLLTGTNALTLAVDPSILANPSRLATSRTGQVGDATNVTRLAGVRDQTSLNNGTQTFQGFYADTVGQIGTQVQQNTADDTATTAVGNQLSAQRQSVSGVDPNEELVQMLQFQRAFQMAANYLSVVNQTLDSLLQIKS